MQRQWRWIVLSGQTWTSWCCMLHALALISNNSFNMQLNWIKSKQCITRIYIGTIRTFRCISNQSWHKFFRVIRPTVLSFFSSFFSMQYSNILASAFSRPTDYVFFQLHVICVRSSLIGIDYLIILGSKHSVHNPFSIRQ